VPGSNDPSLDAYNAMAMKEIMTPELIESLRKRQLDQPEPPSDKVQAIERMAETADREGRYGDVILPGKKVQQPHDNIKRFSMGCLVLSRHDLCRGCSCECHNIEKAEPKMTVPEERFPKEFLEHAVETKSQYDKTFRDLAAEILSLRERLGAAEQRAPIYAAYVEKLPHLGLKPHEICDEISSEIVVKMWETLRQEYINLEAERDRLQEALDGRMRVFQEDAAEIKLLVAKVAELEGRLAEMHEQAEWYKQTTREQIATHDAQVRREALETARDIAVNEQKCLRNGGAINTCKDIATAIERILAFESAHIEGEK
jgi:hypothetical protein